MDQMKIETLKPADREWITQLLKTHWHSTKVVSRGKIHDASQLPGFTARQGAEVIGLITYRIAEGECEIVTLNSLQQKIGAGSALIESVRNIAKSNKCKRLWLITTNDNLHALGFYQKRGFTISKIYQKAMETSRRLKPEIPAIGQNGIPIRDELELEILL
jgi:ribosomal protein S18 acetylase RimI-like enzyme